MAYRIFDHTADLGVEVTAATVRAAASREISVAGADAADLLVNFLRELLAVYYGDGFLLKACRVSGIDSRSLRAQLKGERFDPSRHRIEREIKAVTYHQAWVGQAGEGWKARVVFDV